MVRAWHPSRRLEQPEGCLLRRVNDRKPRSRSKRHPAAAESAPAPHAGGACSGAPTVGSPIGALVATWALSLSVVCGCSWSRFDDVKKNTPVASLEKPKGMNDGFGNHLATTHHDGKLRLFVTGSPGKHGGAAYDLGQSDQPSLEASDTSHCSGDGDTCFLAKQPAALVQGPDLGEPLELCLVSGLGVRFDGDTETLGLITRCEIEGSDVQFAYPLPEGQIADRADELLGRGIGDPLLFAADLAKQPLLVAVWPEEGHAWFYPRGTDTPVVLELPPGLKDDVPSSLAVLRDAGDRLVAIGAEKQGHVWLFRITAEDNASSVGCLGGLEGLGRAMAAGPVTDDEHDDLVISDSKYVHVLSGRGLASLPATSNPSCSLASLPPDTLIASFGCGQDPSVSGCAESEFGSAVAIGDVDGDGDGEVAVGAPFMKVRGERSAGAVLLYDVEDPNPNDLAEIKFISSADSGDRLGEALAMPRLADRHVIAAGAPGGGKTVLFYCNDLLPSSLAGPRCD